MAYYPGFAQLQPHQTQIMPQMVNYTPAAQNAPAGQPGASQGFVCRPVASREEAVAAQTDFFGPGILMPDLGHGMIYLKRFNQTTGASDLLEFAYVPTQPVQTAQSGEFVTIDMFRDLCREVEDLEKGAAHEHDE